MDLGVEKEEQLIVALRVEASGAERPHCCLCPCF